MGSGSADPLDGYTRGMGVLGSEGEGVGSGADALWAPWRLAYIESLGDEEAPVSESEKSGGGSSENGAQSGSFLLDYWRAPEHDARNHVIERSEQGMILLNRYPYANGHLLIALGEARPGLLDYEPEQREHLWGLVDRAVELARAALEPQGMNVGINMGRAGGAGVPSHLHVHVIPRWGGDTNFITSVGGIRVIPSSLEAMYARYVHAKHLA